MTQSMPAAAPPRPLPPGCAGALPPPSGRAAARLAERLAELTREHESLRRAYAEMAARVDGYLERFDLAPVGLVVTDAALVVQGINRRTRQFFAAGGLSPVGAPLLDAFAPESAGALREAVAAAAAPGGVAGCDVQLAHPGRSALTLRAEVRAAAGGGVLVALVDVTDERARALRAEHMALHDRLTGLPNRAQVMDRLERALAGARAGGGSLAVMFIDLDRFKAVNDAHGHAAGDAWLRAAATRMQAALREGDLLARLGGDEFLLLAPALGDAAGALRVARPIGRALAQPGPATQPPMAVTASIGISLFPRDAGDAEGLLRCADRALYRAKHAGRDTVRVYDAAHDGGAPGRVRG